MDQEEMMPERPPNQEDCRPQMPLVRKMAKLAMSPQGPMMEVEEMTLRKSFGNSLRTALGSNEKWLLLELQSDPLK